LVRFFFDNIFPSRVAQSQRPLGSHMGTSTTKSTRLFILLFFFHHRIFPMKYIALSWATSLSFCIRY
jgi:hypothetical protein